MAQVKINSQKCKGCKLCTTVCPQEIVVMSDQKTNAKGFQPAEITDQEQCIGCGFCAAICPDLVIEVYN
ncbi:4Fe-4S binding protein [Halanaerobaculum tunisiense]